ncbi:MAG: LON peptidase substrate-binding domain-containing protein [Candidatus Shikimatogenerans sp. Tcar]|uniref:LON peptidase substrate-binding domain-containing protein n=1 Tax=Candidatus Shikimatogenerans sp. Tcar TaxID=3158565 RepID=A0AAU7QS01_9FLAO
MKNNNYLIFYKLYKKVYKHCLNITKKINLFHKLMINNVIVIYIDYIILVPNIINIIYINNIILINLINKCIKKVIPLVFVYKNNKYGVLVNIINLIINKDNSINLLVFGLEKVKINIIKNFEYYSISNIIIIKDNLITNKINKNHLKYIIKLSFIINKNKYFNILLKKNLFFLKKAINIIYYITYNIITNIKYKLKILNTNTLNKKFFYLKKILIICILKDIIHL